MSRSDWREGELPSLLEQNAALAQITVTLHGDVYFLYGQVRQSNLFVIRNN